VDILWEDERFLALDKPAGLAVIAPDGSRERSLYDLACAIVRRGNPRGRAAVVHRIDKGTSGLVLFAKDAAAKKAMMEGWDALVRERRYAALVEGRLRAEAGFYDSYLVQGRPGQGQERVRQSGSGDRRALRAQTEWRVLRHGPRYQLIEAILLTGRKHQIRVQFSADGHPVAGDALYGARSDPLGRLCLHAWTLVFEHPFTGSEISLESPFPREFERAVETR